MQVRPKLFNTVWDENVKIVERTMCWYLIPDTWYLILDTWYLILVLILWCREDYVLIPGGTGGTDPTSLPRDRFCGQVLFRDQIQKTTTLYNKRFCNWFSLYFKSRLWIERLLVVAGSWLLSWCSLFCEWAWTSESILVITLLLTNLIKWFQVISTVTPFSIGVFTDNTEVLPSPHPLVSTAI